jgi:hypothetical protein
MRARGLSSMVLGIVSLLAVGCGNGDGIRGMAEIRVHALQLSAGNITRVTVEAGGLSQDLTRNPTTGLFNGTLLLPVGTYDLVARAYVDANLVGQSNPTPMEIQAGIVTRVTLRILSTTGGGQPNFGPILDSLTYPTSTQAEAQASFAISVVAPNNDPVAIEWASDCADSTFSAPQSPTTTWSKASPGTCRITVTATSNGISLTESFSIVVFPAGSASGAVTVDGVFVEAPSLYLSLYNGPQGCSVAPASQSASCPGSVASPNVAGYQVNVFGWGNSTPGTLAVSDNCGGRFGATYQNPDSVSGNWLPPVQAGVCIITASAVNGDGVAATLRAAILVREGTPRTASPPRINADFFGYGYCQLSSDNSPANCAPMPAGNGGNLQGGVNWVDGLAGSVSVTDDCGGTFNRYSSDPASVYGTWTPPNSPGATCLLTIRATNLEGITSEAVGVFPLL